MAISQCHSLTWCLWWLWYSWLVGLVQPRRSTEELSSPLDTGISSGILRSPPFLWSWWWELITPGLWQRKGFFASCACSCPWGCVECDQPCKEKSNVGMFLFLMQILPLSLLCPAASHFVFWLQFALRQSCRDVTTLSPDQVMLWQRKCPCVPHPPSVTQTPSKLQLKKKEIRNSHFWANLIISIN